jgi:hypothetical protein
VSNRFEEKQKVTYCRDLVMLKKITLCLLIDEIAIDLLIILKFCKHGGYKKKM